MRIDISETLEAWQGSLCTELPIAGLLARNPVAHKWKATFRSMSLRETIMWRATDLLSQSLILRDMDHLLGARILLRSAYEALAVLIYLNQITDAVVTGQIDFHVFGDKTSQLLLGSKDGSTAIENTNITSVLRHCEKRYPGISEVYARLSESAHPSYDGMCRGYSTIDYDNYTSHFGNRWKHIYAEGHRQLMEICLETLEFEYNQVWDELFCKLEAWLEENDEMLEASKPATLIASFGRSV